MTSANARAGAVCVALALATLAAFGSFAGFEFVNWDDRAYVTQNAHVQAGLTLETVRCAITATDAHNWHPLTWLSHLLDVSLFGVDAVAHHRVNLLLHAATSCLLFLGFLRMMGAFWRSALVAALFALHPLHVESVAWVAERKDVLSGLLFAVVILLWTRYAERPSAARYLALAIAFALGLAAKPMLVTADRTFKRAIEGPGRVVLSNLAREDASKDRAHPHVRWNQAGCGGCFDAATCQTRAARHTAPVRPRGPLVPPRPPAACSAGVVPVRNTG